MKSLALAFFILGSVTSYASDFKDKITPYDASASVFNYLKRGSNPGKIDGNDCTVSVSSDNNHFAVEVIHLRNGNTREFSLDLKSKDLVERIAGNTSLELITENQEGDDFHGSYTITESLKFTAQKITHSGVIYNVTVSVKNSAIEEYSGKASCNVETKN